MGKCKVGQARCCSPVHSYCTTRGGFPCSESALRGVMDRAEQKGQLENTGWIKAIVNLDCVLPIVVGGNTWFGLELISQGWVCVCVGSDGLEVMQLCIPHWAGHVSR